MTASQGGAGWRLHPPYEPLQAHLTDLDLVREDRPTAADKHLADCGDCTRRLRESAGPWDPVEGLAEELALAAAARPAPDWAAAVLPEAVRRLVAPGRPVPDVAAGQVWRLEWHGRRALAAVVDVDGWHVLVAPVTTDVEYADEWSLTVGPGATPLGASLAVFVRVAATVPLFAFDSHVADLPSAADGTTAAASLRAFRRGHLAAAEPPPGHPPLHPDDVDRLGFLDALGAGLAPFVDAGSAADAEEPDEDGALALGDALAAAGLNARALVERAGLEPARALDLVRGAEPTDAERARLRDALGIAVAGAPFPDEAVAALSHPAWRARRVDWNAKHGRAADSNPMALARELESRAAARTEAGRPTSWAHRAAMFFADGEG